MLAYVYVQAPEPMYSHDHLQVCLQPLMGRPKHLQVFIYMEIFFLLFQLFGSNEEMLEKLWVQHCHSDDGQSFLV